MARVIRVFKNHPKKSIFFSVLGTWGAVTAKNKYDEEQLLAAYCKEAQQYGDEPHPVSAKFRHITVVLNPAAAKGKCRAKFDKYCAPLLHLAGLKVALIRTEHEGQARDLMDLMGNTDGVVIAGGDGTLSEVLTGLLRRDDGWEASHRMPLGVLPLGTSSIAGRAIHGISGEPQARDLLEATMAIVRKVMRPVTVMEVTQETDTKNEQTDNDDQSQPLFKTPSENLNNISETVQEEKKIDVKDNKKSTLDSVIEEAKTNIPNTPESADEKNKLKAPKSIFIAGQFEWGAYRDAWERRDKYWYWATLRRYVTYVFSSYKDLSWDCSSEIKYTLPCSGCSRCRTQSVTTSPIDSPVEKASSKRWWEYLVPSFSSSKQHLEDRQRELRLREEQLKRQVDYSQINNPECGREHHTSVSGGCDVRVNGCNTPTTTDLMPHQMLFAYGAPDTSMLDFIAEGWRRVYSNGLKATNQKEELVGSITITPTASSAPVDKQGTERQFSLDGEGYEVRPLTIKVLPTPIPMFVTPSPCTS